jgi:GxxExxY protein
MSDEVNDSTEDDVKQVLLDIGKQIVLQLGTLYGRESFYKKAICAELFHRGYNACQEVSYPIYYQLCNSDSTTTVGNIFVDIVCSSFFLELKNVRTISSNHRSQAKLYSRILRKPGYLMNFSVDGCVVVERVEASTS